MAGNIHAKHRERLRARFEEFGLDGMQDHEVLELLLFYALPRVDTNPIAHELLNTFGSLHRVFEARTEDLAKVKGMGKSSAQFLHIILETARRYEVDRNEYLSRSTALTTSRHLGEYLMPYFRGLVEECVMMLCLDSGSRVLSCVKLCSGTVNRTSVDIRRIAEQAIRDNAAAIVLAHNHIGGTMSPSEADRTTTRWIVQTLGALGIKVRDHIIIAGNSYVSMRDNGLLF